MSKVEPFVSDGAGYLWAYFTGEGEGAEAISLALSQGNDALKWMALNQGEPLIHSTQGEQGLRDPFILRAHDHSKYYLLATDLNIFKRREEPFTGAQLNGSRYIEIFESPDLIHWTAQEHTLLASEYMGNTWAPKAFWDSASKQYVLYWASNLYEDVVAAKRTAVTYNRLFYVTTKDFREFSPPQLWVDVDLGPGKGTIDVTVVKEGEWYYRLMKEEATMTIRLDRSKNLFAPLIGTEYARYDAPDTEWSTVGEEIGCGLPNGAGKVFSAGEGPCIFPRNLEDHSPYRWFLFIDQPGYHGGPNHYVGFASNDLSDAQSWQPLAEKLSVGLPVNQAGDKPRHGSIISLTSEEYQRVYQAFLIPRQYQSAATE